MKKFFSFILLLFSFCSFAQNLPLDSVGWSILKPSNDTRFVYVSSSEGNDANDGSTASSPVATLLRARDLVRNNFPDWILIKRGDTLYDNIITSKYGRSYLERMVYTSYGVGPRPVIIPDNTQGAYFGSGCRGNVAVVGLHFKAGDQGSSKGGVVLLALADDIPIHNFLLEDCVVEQFKDNLNMHGPASLKNITIRRCVIKNAFPPGEAHSQGMFINNVDSLLIEECVIDHNGWRDQNRADATFFNHNMYISTKNAGNAIVRNNIIARGSSHGIQLRCGGLIENNSFLQNPISIQLGGGDPDSNTHVNGVTGIVIDNVILEGVDINENNPRGMGIICGNIGYEGALFEHNIVANSLVDNDVNARAFEAYTSGYGSGVGFNNVDVQENVFSNWRGGAIFRAPYETPTAPSSFNSISNNRFVNNDVLVQFTAYQWGGRAMNTIFPSSQAEIIFEGNRYWSSNQYDRQLNYNGTSLELKQWNDSTGDVGSDFELVDYADPSRSVADYDALLGGPGTLESFMAKAHAQSKDNWDERYTAVALNCFIREGFVEPFTYAAVEDSIYICKGNSAVLTIEDLSLSSHYGISWNGGAPTLDTTFTVSPDTTTIYTAEILDSLQLWKHCDPVVLEFKVIVDLCSAIPDVEQPFFSVAPNPVHSDFRFNFYAQKQDVDVELHNAVGSKVFEKHYEQVNAGFSDPVSVEHLPSGIYSVTVVAEDQRFVRKILLRN